MKNAILKLASALLALALSFVLACNSGGGGNSGGDMSITVGTTFPSGTTTDSAVDVSYTATPRSGASVTQVSYTINGGADEYIYLRGGISQKGTLGSAKVMLAPGSNRIVFAAKDSSGASATYTVPNTPVYDFGAPPSREGASLGESDAGGGVQFVTDQIVVITKNGVTDTQVANAAAALGGTVVAQVNLIGMYWIKVTSQSEAGLRALCNKALSDYPNLFSSASLDTMHPVDVPEPQAAPNVPPRRGANPTNDRWWDNGEWGLTAMNVPQVWDAYKGKLSDTKVGVVDNGFRFTHEDLQLPADNVYNLNINDKIHGSHVMGTIGAMHGNGKGVAGVMDTKRASLFGYDAFYKVNGASRADIIYGLAWNVANGAKVVNFSLGGSRSYDKWEDKDYSAAMRNLLDKGYDFVVVHAAGNNKEDTAMAGVFTNVTDPALRQRIITVGAVDSSFQMADFTNYGPLVDVVAPGVHILSVAAIDDSSYGYLNGTSMAAPHVTGLAGLLWSANPDLTGPKVKQAIVESAVESGRAIQDTRSFVPSSERRTYYFVNAKAAVGQVAVPVTGVTLDPTTMSLTVGGATGSLTATIAPSNATNQNLTWTVNPPTGVVTLSGSGAAMTVTAVAAGAATITVATQDGNKTATCAVTVAAANVPVTGVTLNPTTMSLTVGGATGSLTATIAPSSATNQNLTWTVNPPTGVVTLSGSGAAMTVTAVAAGTATITVATQDGNKTATCAVTVAAANVPVGWAAVSAGFYHTLAIKEDGSLWAWGGNYSGQLGLGTADNGTHPTPARVGTDTNWATVTTCGRQGDSIAYSLAIKTDGSLWAWGNNYYGQLGLGDSGVDTNRKVPTRVGADSNWRAVSAGTASTIAIKTDGSLWAWGCNYYGHLGLGDSGVDNIINVPTRVGTDNNWAAVTTSGSHEEDDEFGSYSLAIKTDGSLWAWGFNYYGQLGLGNKGVATDRKVPTRVGTDSNWRAVSAGIVHAMAIKTDGSLWAWGENDDGELGFGYFDTGGWNSLHTTPARVGAASDWAEVKAGAGHTLAIKTDGSLWTWGFNYYGQLGLGDSGSDTSRHTPARVGAANNWRTVSALGYHTLAIKTDGSLWTWGLNNWGQLGLGDTTNRNVNVPTRVGEAGGPMVAPGGGVEYATSPGEVHGSVRPPLYGRPQHHRPSRDNRQSQGR